MPEFKIGVLLPRSSLYPAIGMDLINGLKAGLDEFTTHDFRLYFENIGFGADESVVYSCAEKLILQEEVDMLIVYADHSAAAKLDPLMSAHKKLILVLDPGAHIPSDWTPSPCRFTISLQAALNNRITGSIAAANGAKRTIFATSFYEAGYLQCYSYQQGLEAGGGKTHEHFVVPFRLEQFNIYPLVEAFSRVQPEAVLALFSAECGKLFLEGYANAGLCKLSPLYASSFMLEEQWLSSVPFLFEDIKGTTAWTKNLGTEMNRKFMKKTKQRSGNDPGIFSMLGWEAAQFTAKAIDIVKTPGGNIISAGDELANIQFTSPRGNLKVDPATNYLFSPSYYVKVIQDESSGNSGLQLLEEVPFSQPFRDQFISDFPLGVSSKWTNTYLCI